MPIRVSCACGERFRVKDSQAGRRGKCPQCGGEVLIPFLEAEDMWAGIECLFGDAAGRTLGFTPLGLSPWAGLALALHHARSTCRQPFISAVPAAASNS